MRIIDGLKIENIAGENIVIDTSVDNKLDCAIVLNDTAAFIFNQLLTDKTADDILKALQEEYTVDTETAKKDIDKVIDTFKSYNILEDL